MAETGRNIGVCVDGSETATKALIWAAEQIYRKGDTVVLLHCYEESVNATPVFSNAIDVSNAYKKEHEGIEAFLGRFENKIKGTKCRSVDSKIEGKIGDTILKMSNQEKISILVTGTRGLGAVKRAFLGSVSDYLVKNAKIPVIVFRDNEN